MCGFLQAYSRCLMKDRSFFKSTVWYVNISIMLLRNKEGGREGEREGGRKGGRRKEGCYRNAQRSY